MEMIACSSGCFGQELLQPVDISLRLFQVFHQCFRCQGAYVGAFFERLRKRSPEAYAYVWILYLGARSPRDPDVPKLMAGVCCVFLDCYGKW